MEACDFKHILSVNNLEVRLLLHTVFSLEGAGRLCWSSAVEKRKYLEIKAEELVNQSWQRKT